MTIQSVSSISNLSSQFNQSGQGRNKPLDSPQNGASDASLTPEQKNTLQDNLDSKLAEQVTSISNNYQTAKDIELAQAHYQQQQKLVDIYLQTNGEEANTEVDINAIASLNNMYAQLHSKVKEVTKELPRTMPDAPAHIMPIEVSINQLHNKQLNTYNEIAMPATTSYLHLSA